MTFIERVLRRMGAVTPSSPGRDFRRFAAVSRALDHENFACSSGATRLVGTRRRDDRFHFDVGGSLAVFGDPGTNLAWNDNTLADKQTTIGDPVDIAEYNTEDDCDGITNLTDLRIEGVTIEHPDVNRMLSAVSFQIIRDPGGVVLDTISLVGMAIAVPVALFTQNVGVAATAPATATGYRVRLSTITPYAFEPSVVAYPNLAVQVVLHFSTVPVAW